MKYFLVLLNLVKSLIRFLYDLCSSFSYETQDKVEFIMIGFLSALFLSIKVHFLLSYVSQLHFCLNFSWSRYQRTFHVFLLWKPIDWLSALFLGIKVHFCFHDEIYSFSNLQKFSTLFVCKSKYNQIQYFNAILKEFKAITSTYW